MTLKEKVAEIEPSFIDESIKGGVHFCPGDYYYLLRHFECEECQKDDVSHDACEACWNQEYIE